MRGTRRLVFAALLGTTALVTPVEARAGGVFLFFQGIAASLGAYGAAGAAVGTALGGAAALGVTVGSFLFGSFAGRLLLSLGLAAVLGSLEPGFSIPKPSAQYGNFAQPLTYMSRIYGEVKTGGPFNFRSGNKNGKKYMGVTICAHPSEGPEEHYLDLKQVELAAGSAYDGTIDDGDVITLPFVDGDPPVGSFVNIRVYTGGSGQVADPVHVADFTDFTSAHDFEGHSHVAFYCRRVSQEHLLKIYKTGREAVYTALWRGWNEIYDPRDGSTGYSNNWSLCLAHEAVHVWGLEVDWDRVAVEADFCDELVTNRDGGSQAKWTFNHKIEDDQDFAAVLAQFLGAADGYIWQRPDGKVDFYAGRWIAPTLTLEAEDFLSLQVVEGDYGLNPPTEYFAEYREPANDHRETPSGSWVVDADSPRIAKPFALYPINSNNQALRVLKPVAAAERAQFKMSGTVGLIGYELIGGRDNDAGGTAGLAHRFINVSHPVLGDTAVSVEVAKIERNPGGNTFAVEFVSADAESRAFVAATEETAPPEYNNSDVADSDPVPTIDDLSGTAVTGTGGVAQILWSWTDPGNAMVPQLRLRQQGQEWAQVLPGEEVEEYLMTGLLDGATYEAQIRARSPGGEPSDWKPDTPGSVEAVANSTAPAAHESGSFSVAESAGDITVEFEAPNDENYYATRIMRADYAAAYAGPYDIGDASLVRLEYGLPGAVDTWTDSGLSTGHYAYWIVPINASGVEGTATGPETEDVS